MTSSNYMLVSRETAYRLSEFSPTTHSLLLDGSTASCVMKVALTILTLGLPLVLALSWDGAVALKNRISSPKSLNQTAPQENNTQANSAKEKAQDIALKYLKKGYDVSSKLFSMLPDKIRYTVVTLVAVKMISKTIGVDNTATLVGAVLKPIGGVLGNSAVEVISFLTGGAFEILGLLIKGSPGVAVEGSWFSVKAFFGLSGAILGGVGNTVTDPGVWWAIIKTAAIGTAIIVAKRKFNNFAGDAFKAAGKTVLDGVEASYTSANGFIDRLTETPLSKILCCCRKRQGTQGSLSSLASFIKNLPTKVSDTFNGHMPTTERVYKFNEKDLAQDKEMFTLIDHIAKYRASNGGLVDKLKSKIQSLKQSQSLRLDINKIEACFNKGLQLACIEIFGENTKKLQTFYSNHIDDILYFIQVQGYAPKLESLKNFISSFGRKLPTNYLLDLSDEVQDFNNRLKYQNVYKQIPISHAKLEYFLENEFDICEYHKLAKIAPSEEDLEWYKVNREFIVLYCKQSNGKFPSMNQLEKFKEKIRLEARRQQARRQQARRQQARQPQTEEVLNRLVSLVNAARQALPQGVAESLFPNEHFRAPANAELVESDAELVESDAELVESDAELVESNDE